MKKDPKSQKGPVPQQALNFSDTEIKKMNIPDSIKGLLIAKRKADDEGDKVTSRKIRRALRASGFYVSKMKE